jgi:hypothetical protein
MNVTTHRAHPALSLPAALLLFGASVFLSSCVSTKYKMARENAPQPRLLNLVAAQPPLGMALNMTIIYRGPGSWKREAFWDEYVVTMVNQGDQPLTINSAALTDSFGTSHVPGADPWALEKASKTLERKYRDAGVAFLRNAGAGVIIVGGGIAATGGFMAGWAAGGSFAGSMASVGSVGAGAAATAVIGVALPLYYLEVWAINSDNKAAIVAEFNRRRLALPLTLVPGETRIGSLFFPMVPNPRSFGLQWSGGATSDKLMLPLDSLQGLHVKAPTSASAGK